MTGCTDPTEVLLKWLNAEHPARLAWRAYREDEKEIATASCQRHLREYAQTFIDAGFDPSQWRWWDQIATDIANSRTRPRRMRDGTVDLDFLDVDEPVRSPIDLSKYTPPDPESPSDGPSPDDWLKDLEYEGRRRASVIFWRYIASPRPTALGRCKRCERYYAGREGKVYCSQACASAASAVRATRERFEALRTVKLERLQKAIVRFAAERRRKPAKDWRRRVVALANQRLAEDDERRVTLTFLTRAINNKDLNSPRRVARHKKKGG